MGAITLKLLFQIAKQKFKIIRDNPREKYLKVRWLYFFDNDTIILFAEINIKTNKLLV